MRFSLCVGMALLLLLSACAAIGQSVGPFPPYPGVWIRHVETKFSDVLAYSARRAVNGDVLISYVNSDDRGNATYSSILFFEGREFLDAMQSTEQVPLLEGPAQTQRLTVGDGLTLISVGAFTCSRGFGAALFLRDDAGRQISGRSIVILMERPKRYPAVTCEEQEFPAFESSVVVLNPNGFVDLADGTILVGDSEIPTIVRLQVGADGVSIPNGTTTNAFVVDAQELNRDLLSNASNNERFDWKVYLESLGRRLRNTSGRLQ